ncbi:substrate-binding domain-containing protein [Streptomyces tsukubensis]|uniref:ABC transporter substrate-binding protein n=1 Tax=Streptomyces tsukubensis TaxID=83656 RepID=A0A1V4A9Y3_9ACTN|nr:substrate-binding domain-containing protein [Streptomyces tsukubensis]OON80124.1 ABC transporter substrate-binding protein [Streptomyces tsukubensis]QFR97354.1 extracellular solute-binding protein [Streptomyces tsukubensis]
MTVKPPPDRRTFLASALGVGAGLALTGCGDFRPRPARLANATAKLPTYIPYRGVPTSMPATKGGVSAGYSHFPTVPARAFPDGPPAKGPAIDIMNLIFNPVPPPVENNTMWQELNRYVGCDLRFEITPVGDYPQKFAVTLAGGDLPDAMLMLPPDQNSAATPDMLDTLFEDLTPHLSGDNIRDYPYLANIPTESWAPCVRNGGIYALPMPRPVSGGPTYTRLDLLKKKDLDPNPKTWREFLRLCEDVTDPRAHQYALGDPTTTWNLVMQMLGAPNWWREERGAFTHFYETDECKQAIDAVHRLKKAGVMHPDAFGVVGRFKDWFGNGQIVMHPDAPAAWNDLYTTYAPVTKGLDVGYMMPPAWDDSTPGGQWQGRANYATLIIKKAPRARVKQILRAMNALAAPFGTDGYLLRKYGVRGPDHTVKGPDPALTPKGTAETYLPTIFATDSPFTLYYPQKPEIVPTQYAFQEEAVEQLIPNPAEALYSATDAKLSKLFNTNFDSLRKGIMQGRNRLGEWDDAVKEWRTKAGDRMRAEYEQAWETRH